MTTPEAPPPPVSLTVVLVGGEMTVDDGSTLDSRQPLVGDPASRIAWASLTSSLLWWTTVASVVQPILDGVADDPYALLIGRRSVVEVGSDGELKRTRLRSLLRGGSVAADIARFIDEPLPAGYELISEETQDRWSGNGLKPCKLLYGCRFARSTEKWVLLNRGDYYLPLAASRIRPAVTVDLQAPLVGVESGQDAESRSFQYLEARRLLGDQPVLIVPHTAGTEIYFRSYLAWTQASRPEADPTQYTPPPPVSWDRATPPDPIEYTCPVPVRAEFKVTGLIQKGEWCDPSHLEAARSLLQARYDLRIGIWDLANNSTLRRTLLGSAPLQSAPVHSVEIPPRAAERAQRRVAEKMEARAHEAAVRERIGALLEPARQAGWQGLTPHATLCLPLTDRVPLSVVRRAASWPNDGPVALVQLRLEVSRRQCAVNASTIMYNQVDLPKYLHARLEIFEQIAAPDECALSGQSHYQVWRRPGGWADDVDWPDIANGLAERTPAWRFAFEDLAAECRDILARWAKEDRHLWRATSTRISAVEVLQRAGPEGMRAAVEAAGESLADLQPDALADVFAVAVEYIGSRTTNWSEEMYDRIMPALGDWPRAYGLMWTVSTWAATQATLEDYSNQGVRYVTWLAADRTCETCGANASAGRIQLGEAFPSGHFGPPAHMRCRCDILSGRT